MAGRWSTENVVSEQKDLQASAMAVDCIGSKALLAGRKNLAFVDLNRPNEKAVKVTRQSKWDIGCVQWNGHASHAFRFVTACNQRLDIFDFREASASHLCSLKAHSRTVSDVDWSPFDVNIVASCSVDTFTYFWDVRDPKKPVKSFQTVSGAYQVKWNKVTNNLFATTHDGDVRIWDPRKGNTPIQYISAHSSKIHGLDWSHKDQHKLVTASQDCTIRFWDYNNPRRSEAILNSGNPVWRARYTPFGDGVVSVVVPQLRRGENSLYLWHTNNSQSPEHTFVGHKDVILEFQWRKQQDGARDYHLVTWSKDQTLRIWKVDPSMQKACGHEFDELTNGLLEEEDLLPSHTGVTHFGNLPASSGGIAKSDSTSSFGSGVGSAKHLVTSVAGGGGGGSGNNSGGGSGGGGGVVGGGSGSASNLGQITPISSMLPVLSLEQEIDEIMGRIPGVKLDQADIVKRTCSFKLSKGQSFVDIELLFPENYPIKISPTITITRSNLEADTQSKLMKSFHETCIKHVKQHLNCVEPCVRQILHLMEKVGSSGMLDAGQHQHEDRKSMLDKKYIVEKVRSPSSPAPQNNAIPIYPTGSFQDSCIPFPRTCGATFCSNDRLVVFGVPVAMKKVHEESEVTPRALSDLVSYTLSQTQWMRSQSNSFVGLFYGSPPSVPEGITISSFYTEKTSKNRHHRNSHHHHHHHHHKSHSRSSRDNGEGKRDKEKDIDRINKRMQKVGSIKIYDISVINPVSKFLAENYKLDLTDIPGTCEHNANVAMKMGRKDLVQIWHLVSQMSHPSLRPSPNVDHGPPWAYCPFGRPLLNKILNHYAKIRDVQTMAMICCIFWDKDPPQRDTAAFMSAAYLTRNESRTSFEYATPNNAETTFSSSTDSGWHVLPMMKSKRSLSWCESYEDTKVVEDKDPREREMERERIQHHNNSKMLDPEHRSQHEQIKKCYANILFKWGLLNQRTQVLKHTDSAEEENRTIEFAVSCFNCSEDVRGVQCNRCRYPALRCSICHIGVRGTANICIACGHGGHTAHMMDWFHSHTVCPTGCGCNCLQDNSW